jgi:hypothetical protein
MKHAKDIILNYIMVFQLNIKRTLGNTSAIHSRFRDADNEISDRDY